MGSNEISVRRGDTPTITIYITNADGTAYDLTNCVLRFTVKSKANDTDDNSRIGPLEATIASPETGIGLIELTGSQTNLKSNTYVFDAQITNTVTDKNYTPIFDNFIIEDDVTKETS